MQRRARVRAGRCFRLCVRLHVRCFSVRVRCKVGAATPLREKRNGRSCRRGRVVKFEKIGGNRQRGANFAALAGGMVMPCLWLWIATGIDGQSAIRVSWVG